MTTMIDSDSEYYMDRFMELYRGSVPFNRLKQFGNSEEYLAFSKKTGMPVTLVSVKDHANLIPTYQPIYEFCSKSPFFWMIPCEVPGGVAGFVLRSFQSKNYFRFQVKGAPPLVYGLHDFADYNPKSRVPIILSEGIKDAICIRQLYPYVLALLTDNVSSSVCSLLSRLTDRVIVACDNDEAGRKALSKTTKVLGSKFISVYPFLLGIGAAFPTGARSSKATKFSVGTGLKDWGQCLRNDSYMELAKLQLQGILSRIVPEA